MFRFTLSMMSLMPASEFPQKQIRMLAGIVDVMKNGGPTDFAGVIDYHITKAEDSLKDRS